MCKKMVRSRGEGGGVGGGGRDGRMSERWSLKYESSDPEAVPTLSY